MSDSPAQKVWLVSNDNAKIEVGKLAPLCAFSLVIMLTTITDRTVVERSMLLKNMLDDLGDVSISVENPIPIPNVSSSPFLLFAFDC